MNATTSALNKIIGEYSLKLNSIAESEFSAKPNPGKWSKKEVLGHLIDSAQNNLRRFICGQYESTPSKIAYDQDRWVEMNDYQHAKSEEIIALWVLMNKRILATLEKMPSSSYSKNSDTGKESVSLHSLEWLAEDYVKHLKHHVNQIIPGSFDVRYPS
jgi:hypothetical protein